MFLNPGCADEYRRRHDALWPELANLLREAGIANYSIYLDEETCAYLGATRIIGWRRWRDHPVMRRWWQHMKDIMRVPRPTPGRGSRSPKCFICLRVCPRSGGGVRTGELAVNGAAAVLDIGKTNVKLATFADDGALLWERSTPNRVLAGPPYPHRGCRDRYGRSSSRARPGANKDRKIATIVATTHACTAALDRRFRPRASGHGL